MQANCGFIEEGRPEGLHYNRRTTTVERVVQAFRPAMDVLDQIANKVRAGERLGADEALELYRHAPTPLLGRLADAVRARKHPGGIVTYIIDRNVNYTNVCVAKCSFCAFYRDVGSPDGYVLGFEELFRKIDETIAVGGVQVLMHGGHNPDLPL